MVSVLAAIMDSIYKDQHVSNKLHHQDQVKALIFIVLEQIQEDYALDVSMDLLYKMEFVLLISKILHVEETQVSVETDSI